MPNPEILQGCELVKQLFAFWRQVWAWRGLVKGGKHTVGILREVGLRGYHRKAALCVLVQQHHREVEYYNTAAPHGG